MKTKEIEKNTFVILNILNDKILSYNVIKRRGLIEAIQRNFLKITNSDKIICDYSYYLSDYMELLSICMKLYSFFDEKLNKFPMASFAYYVRGDDCCHEIKDNKDFILVSLGDFESLASENLENND